MINCVIIDDEPLAREGLASYVREIEFLHLVDTCENPLELIKLMNQHSVDLIFLDIQMPKMNGLELLENIRKREEWNNMKCFIITTSNHKADRKAAEKLGISGYITKPLKLTPPSNIDAFNLMIDLMNF